METILLNLTNYIANSIKHYDYVILDLLDWSTAFETINHNILFIKLQSLGRNQNIFTLIKSYIMDRTCSIKSSNTINQYPDFGVPKKKVAFYVLFFFVFIFDYIMIIIYNVHFHIYANDAQLNIKTNLATLTKTLTEINFTTELKLLQL